MREAQPDGAPDGVALVAVETNLLEANGALEPERRAEMGQYLTPLPVARFMASLLRLGTSSVRVLDAGAGVGTLTAAVAQEVIGRQAAPHEIRAVTYELDASLEPRLRNVLDACRQACEGNGMTFDGEAFEEDFLRVGVAALGGDMFVPGVPLPEGFDCAILNPPYRKLARGSAERRDLAGVLGIEVGNLYAAFVALAVELLKPGGELVAITPRSFCNGPYFKPFRKFYLSRMALRRVHVFETRGDLFGEDGVLQENVIVYAVKEPVAPGATVAISSSETPDEDLHAVSEEPYGRVVVPDDPESFIRVVPDEAGGRVSERMGRLAGGLSDAGVSVSTGRVVDFRVREFLRHAPSADTVPLIYPHNLREGFVEWPRKHAKKASAIVTGGGSKKSLTPNGVYVLAPTT